MNTRKGEIKSFVINTGNLLISDPCYSSPSETLTAKKGKWLGWTETADFGDWGIRSVALWVCHQDIVPIELNTIENNYEGDLPVDAGMMAVSSDIEDWGSDSDIYNGFCRLASYRGNTVDGIAFVCTSGFGDGRYPFYVLRNDKGEVYAIKVVFEEVS